MDSTDRFVAGFHAAFLLIAALAVLVLGRGWVLVGLVCGYNAGLIFLGRRHPKVKELWWFLAPLSALLVLPDWVLADGLRTLVFPRDGAPRIGAVHGAMAGMWTIPLFVVLYVTERVTHGRATGALVAAGLSLLVFGAAEEVLPRLPLWRAQNVQTIGHVAIYVLPAEALLGAVTWFAFLRSRHRGVLERTLSAAAVTLLYTGTLAVSWLVVERML